MAAGRFKKPVKKLKPVRMIRGPEAAPIRAFRPGVVGAIAIVVVGLGLGIRKFARRDAALAPPTTFDAAAGLPAAPAAPPSTEPPPGQPAPRSRMVWPDAATATETAPAASAARGGGPQQRTEAAMQIRDILTDAVVNAAFARLQSEVTACHSLYFRGTVTVGQITVRVQMTDQGITETGIESSSLPSALFGDCVARTASHVSLPSLPAGARAAVRYTYTFQAQ